jgi:NAD(P)H dehydrogenase (quinone)
MLVQVVHCHPLPASYNHALFCAIVSSLEQNGHEVVTTDLYREQFDPVMEAPPSAVVIMMPITRMRRYQPKPRYCAEEGVIFCFPQWWFSMPARLKGYFDRVWAAPGIAFEHNRPAGGIRPQLTHIKVFGVVMTYGSP